MDNILRGQLFLNVRLHEILYNCVWKMFCPHQNALRRKGVPIIAQLQGFLWRYAPIRRTGTFFQSKEKQLFVMYIFNE